MRTETFLFYHCLKTVLFYGYSLYVCAGTHMHMCVHICRGQRINSEVILQVLLNFTVTGSLIGLELCQINQTWWPASSKDLLVSISHLTIAMFASTHCHRYIGWEVRT